MELTVERSTEQGYIIAQMSALSQLLDVKYLKEALAQMRENHSFREAAAVLNPNPFTHSSKQDLNAAKMKQLELFLSIAENVSELRKATDSLKNATETSQQLKEIFGL